jgi:hypothetical protein
VLQHLFIFERVLSFLVVGGGRFFDVIGRNAFLLYLFHDLTDQDPSHLSRDGGGRTYVQLKVDLARYPSGGEP